MNPHRAEPVPGSAAYAWCESSAATDKSPWHIRKLDETGRHVGGGITTASLCGRVKPRSQGGVGGWDLSDKVPITKDHKDVACEQCWAELLDRLVPIYIEVSILRALFESQASELGSRMTAMESATKKAAEMIGKYTLLYNRARQAAITTELMEIIGGAEALRA